MAYSKEELKSFESKDLRISKLAIIKSLIEKLEDANDTEKIFELAETYVEYVYRERVSGDIQRKEVKEVDETLDQTIGWKALARSAGLVEPTTEQIKMLSLLWDKQEIAKKWDGKPASLCKYIIQKFGSYPTKVSSVEKVIKSFN